MSSRDLCDRRLPFEDAWVTTRSARGARQHAPASQASNQGCSWRLVDLLGSSQTNSGKPSFLEYRVVAGVIDCDNNCLQYQCPGLKPHYKIKTSNQPKLQNQYTECRQTHQSLLRNLETQGSPNTFLKETGLQNCILHMQNNMYRIIVPTTIYKCALSTFKPFPTRSEDLIKLNGP